MSHNLLPVTDQDLERWEEVCSEVASTPGRFNWPTVVLRLIAKAKQLQEDLDQAVAYKLAEKETPKGEWDQ